jgi:hypothetical protein
VRNVHGQCVKAMQSGILSSRMKVKLLCNRLNRYTEVPGNDGCSARHLERRKGYVQYSEYSMVSDISVSPHSRPAVIDRKITHYCGASLMQVHASPLVKSLPPFHYVTIEKEISLPLRSMGTYCGKESWYVEM